MKKMKFIDLFAGIGGIRLGFERVGGECVFSSEWDKYAQDTTRQILESGPMEILPLLTQKLSPTMIFY